MNSKTLLLLSLVLCYSFHLFGQKTEIVFLSGKDAARTVEWDFYCTDGQNSGKWSKIPVPSNWELQGYGTYNYGHDHKRKDVKLGKEHGLYKHEFEVPASWKGKTVKIVFDGSMTDTKVKINGKSAGKMHQGAFYRFKYDISKLLDYGTTNLLEVDVAKHSANASVNAAERQADFWLFGGIFRPVFLEVLPKTHMARTAINAKADGSFQTLIELNKSKSDYSLAVELFDMTGNPVGKAQQYDIGKGVSEKTISGKFENVASWNPERPTLYDMRISLKKGNDLVHQVTERIGFRTVELREHDGFYVNGEKVVFKGVNRHSFWPETGRALSEEHHRTDIRLMKEMNMNAVRMSHYVPDKRFLQLCDSLGLFVLDEVTGWQDGYDTTVGPKLIKETVLKDENHPSVVAWNHGNEAGWDFANEKWFHHWDLQERPVIYPWLLRNGIDTHHYPKYDYAVGRFVDGNAPFMPTEFLHGLYDGGHGAGLNDYWTKYSASPLFSGGFLWVLADEAVLRTDQAGTVFDSDGNNAPDGILGPHREKEGSFYTIKEIWSPVQVRPVTINDSWNGSLFLENKFIYTNLKECRFEWEAVKTEIGRQDETVIGSGTVPSPDALPGETARVDIEMEVPLTEADIFRFTALDPQGNELYSWSRPVVQPEVKAAAYLSKNYAESEIQITDENNRVIARVSDLSITFNKADGTLKGIENAKGPISLAGGPVPVGTAAEIEDVQMGITKKGDYQVTIRYTEYPKKLVWTVKKNGLLGLAVDAPLQTMNDLDYLGVTFNYPEEKVNGITWMGRGPYRVWKNRIKGSNLGVWQKAYNNTVTGESFNNLVYPEFKGYHADTYWMTFDTDESDFTIISETPNLYFRLFTPEEPKHVRGGVYPPFPKGAISFLYEIPAIGTKFNMPDRLGPSGQKGAFNAREGDQTPPIKVWFDFRTNRP
ncbi:glycoside hydrolase family 2 TIM barrel-domain containing protein [Maribacter sp. 2307ULW6-5]|uniref:glycoside hydrolase family 2 TIM barrel-domain containing protein n=1 Tax=Maribacter sp. 2307ULW6-5 TaxID=3386275 RepID=UPI0039BC7072